MTRATALEPTSGYAHSSPPAPEERGPLIGPFGRRALRIGRVFGIDVGLDVSWIFIFLLITFSLANGFAQGSEEWTTLQAWSGAVLASLLFFTSILLHEFGHSLTSKALGLPVTSITLFIFGGLARLSGEPKKPRDEFLIAAAGPVVSVILGVGFLAASFLFSSDLAAIEVLGVVCGWLGTVNLVLAGFNLVPGFPLDGGRLFRAAVWHFTGDFERATIAAATAGSLFAYGLIGMGIMVGLMAGALFNGLWLVFIGWFLLSAARGSTLRVVLERQLGGIALGAVATPAEPVVGGGTSVQNVIDEIVLKHGNRVSFVGEDGVPLGMVTLHELKRVPAAERGTTPVRAIMLSGSELKTAAPETSLWSAFELMDKERINQLPVASDGRIIGLLTRERLLEVIQNVRALDPA